MGKGVKEGGRMAGQRDSHAYQWVFSLFSKLSRTLAFVWGLASLADLIKGFKLQAGAKDRAIWAVLTMAG